MSLENPQLNTGEMSSGEAAQKKEGGLKRALRQAAVFGAAVLSGEGCKPDAGSSADNQAFARESLKVLNGLQEQNSREQEKILQNYFYSVEHPMGTVLSSKNGGAETTSRVWDMVKKKGFFKNGPDGKIHMTCERVGLVPVKITVNGQVMPVGPDDYTPAELRFIRTTDTSVESIGSFSAGDSAQKTESHPSKPFISGADNF